jgi:hypothetical protein
MNLWKGFIAALVAITPFYAALGVEDYSSVTLPGTHIQRSMKLLAESTPVEVSPSLIDEPQHGFVFEPSPENARFLKEYRVVVRNKAAEAVRIAIQLGQRCEWAFPTPQAGEYIVSMSFSSGTGRTGNFGYITKKGEHISKRFELNRTRFGGLLKTFKIFVPRGQTKTRMFVTGPGRNLYFQYAFISKVKAECVDSESGKITKLCKTSYRTVIRKAKEDKENPSCLILVPEKGIEARAGRSLASRLGIKTAKEPELEKPFPAYPKVEGATENTSLIVLCAGKGGPLVRALRRAGHIQANEVIPGPGGYIIRTVPHPFESNANVIVVASSDSEGLSAAVKAFKPKKDDEAREIIYDTFLVDVPGERWAKLRNYRHRRKAGDDWFRRRFDALKQPFAGKKGGVPCRSYISTTWKFGDWYWKTGNSEFARLFKQYMFKMEDDNIYGHHEKGADSHMELYGLMRAWDRCEESGVFTEADRLRITNYLFHRCVEGNEGFARSYSDFSMYSGDQMGMRHNHQTILACGMMQSYLYYWRHYKLGRAKMWKKWCDDLVENGTRWGHAPEDSANYEAGTFLQVADMLHYQGLSTKGAKGTEEWPNTALRFTAIRDSFSLPSAYGDCWSTFDSGKMRFIELFAEDWDWPAGQWLADRMIKGYKYAAPKHEPAREQYTYLHGSKEAGGVKSVPDKRAALKALEPLLGLAAVPMGEGYHKYLSAEISNDPNKWLENPKPKNPPYKKTADKIQYRSGWDVDDTYMLLECIGWANHGHMDLGTVVQYCQGGRLWIVDGGYDNTDVWHHSTLQIAKDGKDAWGQLKGERGRWGDFRAGPQMLELVKMEPSKPGPSSTFSVTCRVKGVAEATWTRKISGGKRAALVIEDTVTANASGEFDMTFRLRLLGEVKGRAGRWSVKQKGAALPIELEVQDGDVTGLRKWEPDGHTRDEGRYPWYTFIEDDGTPKTIEWNRKIRLSKGRETVFKAVLGPARKIE